MVHTDDVELADCGFHDTESLESGGERVTGFFLSCHMDISEQDWETLDALGSCLKRGEEKGGRRVEEKV